MYSARTPILLHALILLSEPTIYQIIFNFHIWVKGLNPNNYNHFAAYCIIWKSAIFWQWVDAISYFPPCDVLIYTFLNGSKALSPNVKQRQRKIFCNKPLIYKLPVWLDWTLPFAFYWYIAWFPSYVTSCELCQKSYFTRIWN